MGEIRASVTLENSWDRENVDRGLGVKTDVRRTTVEGIVDTGAVNLVIPKEIATLTTEVPSATGPSAAPHHALTDPIASCLAAGEETDWAANEEEPHPSSTASGTTPRTDRSSLAGDR